MEEIVARDLRRAPTARSARRERAGRSTWRSRAPARAGRSPSARRWSAAACSSARSCSSSRAIWQVIGVARGTAGCRPARAGLVPGAHRVGGAVGADAVPRHRGRRALGRHRLPAGAARSATSARRSRRRSARRRCGSPCSARAASAFALAARRRAARGPARAAGSRCRWRCSRASLWVLALVAIGLSAFWIVDTSPMYWVWQKLGFVLGGLLFPLELYPGLAAPRSRALTPFPNLCWAAGRSAFGFAPREAAALFAEGLVWGALLRRSLLCALSRRARARLDGERRLAVARLRPTLAFARALVATNLRASLALRGAFWLQAALHDREQPGLLRALVDPVRALPRDRRLEARRHADAVRCRRRRLRARRSCSSAARARSRARSSTASSTRSWSQPKPVLLQARRLDQHGLGLGRLRDRRRHVRRRRAGSRRVAAGRARRGAGERRGLHRRGRDRAEPGVLARRDGAARAPGLGVHAGVQPVPAAAVRRRRSRSCCTRCCRRASSASCPSSWCARRASRCSPACSPRRVGWCAARAAASSTRVCAATSRAAGFGARLRLDAGDGAVHRAESARRRGPRHLARAGEAARAQLGGERRVAARAAQRVRERVGRTRVDEQRRVAGGFGQRGRVRAHDRRAAGHRFEHGEPEALVEARHRADARRADQRDELLLGDADQPQACARACPCGRAPPRPRARRRCRARPARAAAPAAAPSPRSAPGSSCAARAGRSRSRSRRASRAASRATSGAAGWKRAQSTPEVHRVYPRRGATPNSSRDLAGGERAVGDHVVRARHRVADLPAALLVPVGADPLGVPHRVQVVDRHELGHARRARHEHAHRVEERRPAQQHVVQRIGDEARVRVGRVGLPAVGTPPAAEPGAQQVVACRGRRRAARRPRRGSCPPTPPKGGRPRGRADFQARSGSAIDEPRQDLADLARGSRRRPARPSRWARRSGSRSARPRAWRSARPRRSGTPTRCCRSRTGGRTPARRARRGAGRARPGSGRTRSSPTSGSPRSSGRAGPLRRRAPARARAPSARARRSRGTSPRASCRGSRPAARATSRPRRAARRRSG